jgi:hypothetical protein
MAKTIYSRESTDADKFEHLFFVCFDSHIRN